MIILVLSSVSIFILGIVCGWVFNAVYVLHPILHWNKKKTEHRNSYILLKLLYSIENQLRSTVDFNERLSEFAINSNAVSLSQTQLVLMQSVTNNNEIINTLHSLLIVLNDSLTTSDINATCKLLNSSFDSTKHALPSSSTCCILLNVASIVTNVIQNTSDKRASSVILSYLSSCLTNIPSTELQYLITNASTIQERINDQDLYYKIVTSADRAVVASVLDQNTNEDFLNTVVNKWLSELPNSIQLQQLIADINEKLSGAVSSLSIIESITVQDICFGDSCPSDSLFNAKVVQHTESNSVLCVDVSTTNLKKESKFCKVLMNVSLNNSPIIGTFEFKVTLHEIKNASIVILFSKKDVGHAWVAFKELPVTKFSVETLSDKVMPSLTSYLETELHEELGSKMTLPHWTRVPLPWKVKDNNPIKLTSVAKKTPGIDSIFTMGAEQAGQVMGGMVGGVMGGSVARTVGAKMGGKVAKYAAEASVTLSPTKLYNSVTTKTHTVESEETKKKASSVVNVSQLVNQANNNVRKRKNG